MRNEELLGFLQQIEYLFKTTYKLPATQVKGDRITLVGSHLARWRNGWRLFRNLERIRMTGVIEIEGVTFTVNREQLREKIAFYKRAVEVERLDKRKTIAELFVKGNSLNVRITIGEKDFERRVQRLNYGSNIHALITYGLNNPGKMITIDKVQANRKQSDSKLRDIADTLSKDKAKALEPLLDVFFSDISKHTVTIRPLVSVGQYKAKTILDFYDKKSAPENTPKKKK